MSLGSDVTTAAPPCKAPVAKSCFSTDRTGGGAIGDVAVHEASPHPYIDAVQEASGVVGWAFGVVGKQVEWGESSNPTSQGAAATGEGRATLDS